MRRLQRFKVIHINRNSNESAEIQESERCTLIKDTWYRCIRMKLLNHLAAWMLTRYEKLFICLKSCYFPQYFEIIFLDFNMLLFLFLAFHISFFFTGPKPDMEYRNTRFSRMFSSNSTCMGAVWIHVVVCPFRNLPNNNQ